MDGSILYRWVHGWSLWFREKYKDAHGYLRKALDIGEQTEDQKIIGYACAWISWTCTELGALEEAIVYGERAQEISKDIPSDHYLFFKSLAGIGYACLYTGNIKRALEAGTVLLDYGQKHSNIRSMVMGYFVLGLSFLTGGDFPSAIEACKKGIQTAQDPLFVQISNLVLGMGYAQNGQFQEAEEALQEVASYSRDFGCEQCGTPAHAFLGLVSISQGQMEQGLGMIEEALRACLENQRRYWYARIGHALGLVYLQINVPSAARNAGDHFNRVIEVAKEIGAKGILGRAYLDLGLLDKTEGRVEEARRRISDAIQIFEECGAEALLKQARQVLQDLK